MKKYILLTISILTLTLGCDKNITEAEIAPLSPLKLNENAGTWKTFIITDPSQIAVALPKLVNDAAYLAEVDSLKKIVLPAVNASQKASINYWGAGYVFRWNQIARDLAAKYNLPPVENADGTYPVPDPNNPLVEPKFPFANPPYASRAFAYLSVAQYDALVAGWFYKYKFNRKALSATELGVAQALPASNLPAYPSEAAVVSGASYSVLLSRVSLKF